MEQEARIILQTVDRQDLEAGTGFTVHFRAQLQVEAVVQMAARQERLPTPIWRNAGTL